jgi:hypothetical protein
MARLTRIQQLGVRELERLLPSSLFEILARETMLYKTQLVRVGAGDVEFDVYNDDERVGTIRDDGEGNGAFVAAGILVLTANGAANLTKAMNYCMPAGPLRGEIRFLAHDRSVRRLIVDGQTSAETVIGHIRIDDPAQGHYFRAHQPWLQVSSVELRAIANYLESLGGTKQKETISVAAPEPPAVVRVEYTYLDFIWLGPEVCNTSRGMWQVVKPDPDILVGFVELTGTDCIMFKPNTELGGGRIGGREAADIAEFIAYREQHGFAPPAEPAGTFTPVNSETTPDAYSPAASVVHVENRFQDLGRELVRAFTEINKESVAEAIDAAFQRFGGK